MWYFVTAFGDITLNNPIMFMANKINSKKSRVNRLFSPEPWSRGEELRSKMASSTACKAFCTILSLGEIIPRGLV